MAEETQDKAPGGREWLSYLLTIFLPFVFLYVMHLLKGGIDQPRPLIFTLQHPFLLMYSALFSNVGAFIGLKWIIKQGDTVAATRIKYTNFGVMSVFVVFAVIYFLINGGMTNPQ
jgi:hypothetical protein